jgi:DNA-binding MarR family transcriptional regulator
MPDDLIEDPRLTAFGLLIEVHGSLRSILGSQSPEHRLSQQPDFDALMRLARSPGCRLRMSDLAAQMSLSTSGATRLVDRLEDAGLVRREPCHGDRRSMLAVLTDRGASRVSAILPGLLDSIERWFTGLLTPEQLAETVAALRDVRDTVRPGADAGSVQDR